MKESNFSGRPYKDLLFNKFNFRIYGISEKDQYFVDIRDNFEANFFELCDILIEKDFLCIDIGANIGLKSLYLAKHVSNGHVIAIEASPTVFECLLLNVEINNIKNITLKNCAIGDSSGYTYFNDNSAWGHISNDGVKVEKRTLSSIVNELNLERVDFIKIDVEGYEFPILKNSFDLINKYKSIVLFEFNSYAQLAFGKINPREFIEWVLKNFTYVYCLMDNGNVLFEQIDNNEEDIITFFHRNLVFDGCVSDILVTNDESRIAAIKKLFKPISTLDENISDIFSILLNSSLKFLSDGNNPSQLLPQYLQEQGYLDKSFGYKTGPANNWTVNNGWIGEWPCPDGKRKCFGVGILGDNNNLKPIIEKYKPQALQIFFPYPKVYDENISTGSGQLLMIFRSPK